MIKKELPAEKGTIFYLSFTPETPSFEKFSGVVHPPPPLSIF